MRNTHRLSLALVTALLSLGLVAADAATTATVSKPKVEVRRGPDFKTPAVATLAKDASVTIAGQQVTAKPRLNADATAILDKIPDLTGH